MSKPWITIHVVGRVVTLATAVVFSCGATSFACDFTVRDIGFVPPEKPRYTLIVVGADSHVLDEETVELAGRWGLQTLCMTWASAGDLPEHLEAHRRSSSEKTTVWLVDDRRRGLLLDTIADAPRELALSDVLDEQLGTPYQRQLQRGATRSFAQIVLFEGEPSAVEQARKAAAALKQIEPMLPRPISLPAQVIVIPVDQREHERVLLWALGVDDPRVSAGVMGVIYGRGRLAGGVMVGDAITHASAVAQLALVGESCECETDRDWLDERSLPFYWDEEQDRSATGILGFNPGNAQVQAEVRRVIARGRRQNSGRNGDTIERIVASYMESQVEGYQPARLTIPPGADSAELALNATVIQGEGWGFDDGQAKIQESANDSPEFGGVSIVFHPTDPNAQAAEVPLKTSPYDGLRSIPQLVIGIAAFVACAAIWRAANHKNSQSR